MSAPRKIAQIRPVFILWTTLICWPIQVLGLMVGLRLLRDEGFDLPTPGYWSSFIVMLGVNILYTAVTLTRTILETGNK